MDTKEEVLTPFPWATAPSMLSTWALIRVQGYSELDLKSKETVVVVTGCDRVEWER